MLFILSQEKLDKVEIQIDEALKEKNYDYSLILIEKLVWDYELRLEQNQKKAELYDNLLWHDSHTDTVTIVRESGVYWVSASNTCGVETDSIKVTTENCLCQEFLPNVFTPNNDRLNDFFGYQSNCIPSKYYSLQIFNRWGEQIFESRDYNEKWDGTYKGSLCPTGVYSYLLIVQYKNDLGKRTIKRKFSL